MTYHLLNNLLNHERTATKRHYPSSIINLIYFTNLNTNHMNTELEQPEKLARAEDIQIKLRNFMPPLPQDKVILTVGKWIDADYRCESVTVSREDAEKLSGLFNIKINGLHA